MLPETKTKPSYKVQTIDEYLASGGQITKAKKGEMADRTGQPWDIQRSWKRKKPSKDKETLPVGNQSGYK